MASDMRVEYVVDANYSALDELGDAAKKAGKDVESGLGKADKAVDRFGNALTDADKAMGRFIDTQGKMREANGQFVKGLQKTTPQLNGITKGIRGIGGPVGMVVAKMAAATAAIVAFAAANAQTFAEIDILSKRASTSAEMFQTLSSEAKKFGVDADGLADILQDTADRVGEFTRLGEGEFVDIYEEFFKPIGIGVKELESMRPEVVLMTLQKQMDAAGTSANEQKAVYEQLASNSSYLADVWSMTTDELVKLNEAKRDKGEIFTKEEVQRGKDISDKVKEMRSSFTRLGAAIVLSLEKPLSWAFDAVKSLANMLTDILITTDTERLEYLDKELERLKKKDYSGYSYQGDNQRKIDEAQIAAYTAERARLEKEIAESRKQQTKEMLPYKAADEAQKTSVVDDSGTAYGEKVTKKAVAEALKAYREKQRLIKQGQKEIDKEYAALDKFESLASDVMLSVEDDPQVRLEMERDARLKELKAAYMASDLADTQTFVDASKAIWQGYYDSLQEMNDQTLANNLDGAAQFSGALSGAFGSLADAMKSAGKEGSSAYQAALTAQKAFALSSASLSMGQAVAQAMADWKTTDVAGKLSAAAAITTAFGNVISTISSVSLGGGRRAGGPVQAGKMYEVGEAGVEMFQSGGKNFMIPDRAGNVVPNGDIGGASSYVINQNFYIESGQLENPETLKNLMNATKAQTMQILQQQSMQGGMLAR